MSEEKPRQRLLLAEIDCIFAKSVPVGKAMVSSTTLIVFSDITEPRLGFLIIS